MIGPCRQLPLQRLRTLPTLTMIKNFAQDIANIEVGRNWAYDFVKRPDTDLGCTWFDGFDIARRRADKRPRYKVYFELVGLRTASDLRP